MSGTVKDLGNRVVYKDKNIVFEGTGHVENDAIVLKDDFLGDTLDANLWSSVADTGCTAAAIVVQRGGGIDLITDATDEDRVDFAGEIIWRPANGLIFETRLKVSDITNVAINAGFSDAKSEAAQTIAANLATTTFTTTASNAALWLFDTDATTDTWRGIGVKADTDSTAVNSSIAPVNDTYQRFRIEIDASGNAVFKVLDDSNPYSAAPLYQAYSANAVTTTTLLTPYIAVQNKSASAHTLTVDYVFCAQLSR